MAATADTVDQLARLLRDHERTLVFTGAGISTASGIPDYRGPKGVWKTRRPVYYQDFMTSAAARREYWQQKSEDHGAFGAAEPNSVHLAIVDLEEAGRVEMVVTQNVDGLHRAAGTPPEHLIEIHGTNTLIECQSCGDRSEPGPHFAAFAATGEPPACACGGYLKPATISFGQNLRSDDLTAAFSAAERCDLVIALGSTLSVAPAADIPLHAARRGTPYVVINRGDTGHDGYGIITLRLEADVGEVFPAAVARALDGNRSHGSSR
jgi:NAD-dependent deacetylase